MQLIEMTICGFGSFAKEETIHFDQMDGLWLVTGVTGAGKTTIFDALTFALFGRASGSKTGNTSLGLRSDFISEKDKSFV